GLMERRERLRGFLVFSTLLCIAGSVALGGEPPVDPEGGPIDGGGPRGPGQTWMVDCTGAGDFTTIQDAINASNNGDEVVVFPNTCTPSGHWTAPINFFGKAITVRSVTPEDEAIVDATVIDGMGSIGPLVTMSNGETTDSVLEGLTIVNGVGGTHSVPPIGTVSYGGGVSIEFASGTIRNCAFAGNRARDGGAIRALYAPSVSIEYCRFAGNIATTTNGAAAVSYSNITGEVRFLGCSFSAHQQAAVNVNASYSNPSICNCNPGQAASFELCEFSSNSKVALVAAQPVLTRCAFVGNSSDCIYGAHVTIDQCQFIGNESNMNIVTAYDSLTILGSDFEDNSGENGFECKVDDLDDVIVDIRRSSFRQNVMRQSVLDFEGGGVIEDCVFVANESDDGTVHARITTPLTVDRCAFKDNDGGYGPGGIDGNAGPLWILRNSSFVGNSSSTRPGAIDVDHVVMSNCLIVGNRGGANGGGAACSDGEINHCTIVGNTAPYISGAWASSIRHSIIFDNRTRRQPDHSFFQAFAGDVDYCDFGGFLSWNSFVMNPTLFDVDPHFVDPGSWDDMGTPDDVSDDVFTPGDYHLLPSSPCIDSGDPAFEPESGETDLDGSPRLQSCRVDMGAYEFPQSSIVIGDIDGDGELTIDDLPGFAAQAVRPRGIGLCAADFNGDLIIDGHDVAAFTEALLGS
ncbi:MAG: hypothetical protein KDA33_14805, partial [Phycisphaerales bacterium]|nr:hypothetical protein [Phycisphaerales bacterium]